MQIKEAKIFQFGKLQNQTVTFEPGINVIYGKNEAGKSTLHAFLKAMLFGMEKGRGRSAAGGDYARYTPWHAPSYYAGALRFEVGGQPFYLERNFYGKEKQDCLRNEADGEELSVAYGDLSMLLGGITAAAYGSTYDISQSGAASGAEMERMLSDYLAQTGERSLGTVPLTEAVAALEKRRKELLQEQRKLDTEKEAKIAELEVERKFLTEECAKGREAVERFAAEQRRVGEELLREQKRLEKAYMQEKERAEQDVVHKSDRGERGLQQGKGRKRRRKYSMAVMQLVTIVLLVTAVVQKSVLTGVLTGIAAGVCLAAGLFSIWWKNRSFPPEKEQDTDRRNGGEDQADRQGQEHQKEDRQNKEASLALLDQLQAAATHGEQMLKEMSDSLREKENRLFNVEEEQKEQQAKSEPERRREEDIQALELAVSELQRVAGQLGEELEDRMNGEISRYVSLFTENRYDRVQLDDCGKLQVFTEGRQVRPEVLSRGTLEQIYLALRLSAGKALSGEECLPILLDEAFAMYDDDRLEQTLGVLSEFSNQILIFTCQGREEALLRKKGIRYHKVKL